MPQRHPADTPEMQKYYNSPEVETFKKLWFSNFNKKTMPQKHPADTLEQREYYNSPEFETFKKLWFSNFNKKDNNG